MGCLFLVTGLACEPRSQRDQAVLLFSANNNGVIAACGCAGNPSGGLAKRQWLIEYYRRSPCSREKLSLQGSRSNLLVVDAGDLFPDCKHPTAVDYLARIAARAGYDAIALGDQEFLVGVERLRTLCRDYNLPFLCANVRDAAGEPIVPAHLVRQVAGRRVGIFAVVADHAYGWPPVEWRGELRIESPLSAARREVETLARPASDGQAGCDLIIALSHQSLEASRRLAAEVPGIDIVVCGHEETTLREPERIGRTFLLSTGAGGQILGVLALRRARDGRWEGTQELVDLSARMPAAAWVEDLYWEYVKEAREKPPPEWGMPTPSQYEPAEACARCHQAQYDQWKTTAHARAYESLKKVGRHEDPQCRLCHTMGSGRTDGFVSSEKTPGLAAVTCQACHVVTSQHAEQGVKPEPQIHISSRWCMSCHGPVRSPDFDYFVYKPKILHHPEGGKD